MYMCETRVSNKGECNGIAFESRGVDLEHAEDNGQDERVDACLSTRLAPGTSRPEVDEVGLDEPIPEEAIVCPCPQRAGSVLLRLSLEAAREVDGVGEVHRARLDEVSQE